MLEVKKTVPDENTREVILCEEKSLIESYSEVKIMENTHIYNNHALISSKITTLRDENTPSSLFRTLVEEITILLSSDALSNLLTEPIAVRTPICRTVGDRVAGKKLVLVPILRAGLAMEPAMKRVVPQARTGFCGLYRDEETLEPHEYFWKMPKDIENRDVFILDPMLATGGSINFTVARLKNLGCKSIKVMCIIAAPQGVDLIQKAHPDVEMYVAHLDKGLNKNGYIVPGLGDAGDRIFGTK